MADTPPLPDQPLPDWMSWSLVTGLNGNEGYTIVTLPLTYYGPSIPLGTDGVWTYGGLTSPVEAPTETPTSLPPATEPGPTTANVTPTPPATSPTVTAGTTELSPSPSGSTIPPTTVTSTPLPSVAPTSSLSSSSASSPSSSPSLSSSTLLSTGGVPSSPSSAPTTPSQPSDFTSQPPGSPSPTSDAASTLPSVTGTARTYLGLAPGAFLGLILAIVLSILLLLCCLLAWICHRRRKQRKQLNSLPPPTSEPTSRLLAGDRDPTREDLTYPTYANREYRRSQIAIMRARGELDDEWDDRRHSPSMRSASIRLPEDDVGTAYGIRERAFAAAGVGAPYSYTPISKGPPSAGTGVGSIGNSTVVPSPARAALITAMGLNDDNRSSPTPRKDTQSTQATNDSSAIHMYAAGGRSRVDSSEGADPFFSHQTSEGEAPSPMASSSDLHALQRNNSRITAVPRAHRSNGSLSSGDNTVPQRTRNLEDISRSAIGYPESPVSDDLESSHLMPESEGPSFVARDAPSRQSRSTRESGISRWMHDRGDRPPRISQQPAILQRVLQRVMGNRLSTQPTFSIIPPTPVPQSPSSSSHPEQQHSNNPPSRLSGRDFNVGGGLLFPRPPVYTGYSSGASTSRDDMRRLGGILPSRWSFGTRPDSQAVSLGHNGEEGSLSQMEEGTPRAAHMSYSSPDITPVMRERPPTPGGLPLLGLAIRPPPPSAYPSDSRMSGMSSGMSTVYYDARSHASTPMGTLGSGHDRAPSALTRYDSPPPQPTSALRAAESAHSLRSRETPPIFPPGLFAPSPHPPGDDEELDALDLPPPLPTHDIRQPRSLNTIFSVGTAETYDTTNPPLSIGRAYLRDEQARFPPPGLEPAPRISRSVPSDVALSEIGGSDIGRGSQYDSFGRTRRTWNPADESLQEGDLDDEPPMAASQWRVLSSYPREAGSSMGGSMGTSGSRRDIIPHPEWRLTLGQPVVIYDPQDEQGSSRHSHFGLPVTEYERSDVSGSQGSRGSSNRTNVSHSRDIHSLRASEGGNTGGSNGSKGSNQTGTSRRSVSEYGQLNPRSRSRESEADEALLSAFGPGPQGGTFGSTQPSSSRNLAAVDRDRQSNNSPLPFPTDPPLSAPANFQETPGIRLIGTSSAAGHAGETGDAPLSAPVLSPRGWPTQAVPLDVSPSDGRRPSEAHSFLQHELPLYSYAPLQSPTRSDSHLSPPVSPPSMRQHTLSSHSHSHSQSHSLSHTHGSHTVETSMGTMTEATTEDHSHELPELPPIPHIPLSDLEHIFGTSSPAVGEVKVTDEEERRRRIAGRTSPQSFLDMPR